MVVRRSPTMVRILGALFQFVCPYNILLLNLHYVFCGSGFFEVQVKLICVRFCGTWIVGALHARPEITEEIEVS